MLSRFVITFLPRNKRLLILWLQSPSAVILEPKKINKCPFQHLLFVDFFYYSHSNWYEVTSHCSFDLHFSNNQWCWTSFHMPLGHLYVFFEKCLFRSSAHFLIGLFWLCCTSWSVCRFWRLIFFWSNYLQIFSPSLWLSFHFACCFLCCAKALEFK